jgi:hypothetical protein
MSRRAGFSADAAQGALDRAAGLGLGLAPPPPRRAGPPAVPDILVCTYDPQRDRFRVVYVDLSAHELARAELADVGDRRVIAWDVDEFRRGVEVALNDGTTTSFSAELPRYLRDEAWRQRADERRGAGAGALGARVAHRVCAAREALGWSVAELARRAGMAAPNVHRVEAGRHAPSPQTVARLAAALGVPLQQLVQAP